MTKRNIGFTILLILGSINNAMAEASAVELIRGNAKFNTVAAVLILIFIVLGITLFLLDRRISRLEKAKEKRP